MNETIAAVNGLGPEVDAAGAAISGLRRYHVAAHGAVWDGGTHPLSERFATLEEAQAVYPHALDLTDEIDWAAAQAAINRVILDWSASGQRYGAVVTLPPGRGRFNRAIYYPASSVWSYQNHPVVNLEGQGRGATIMEWRSNTATITGGYALAPKTASVVEGAVVWSGDSAALHAACTLKGFTMRGPGDWRAFVAPTSQADFEARYGFDAGSGWATAYNADNPKMGQVFEAYGGISKGERTNLDDIEVRGFLVGINLRGGQAWHRGVMTDQCYYGLYGTFAAAAHGDMSFVKCNFGARFAAFGLHPNYSFYGHMDACFLGGAPYAFYKEGSTSGTGHWGDFMCGLLSHCQFESVGNAIFGEGNLTRRHELRDLTLQNCIYREVNGTDTSFPATEEGRAGAIVRDALIDVKKWKRVSILRSHDPDRWVARDEAIFKAAEIEDVTIDGADAFMAAATGKTLFAGNTAGVLYRGAGWQGYALPT